MIFGKTSHTYLDHSVLAEQSGFFVHRSIIHPIKKRLKKKFSWT